MYSYFLFVLGLNFKPFYCFIFNFIFLNIMLPAQSSLVKYDNPILVSTTKGKKGQINKVFKILYLKLPPVENKKEISQTAEILNSILPPRYNIFFIIYREWTENGQLWVQYVSSTPATRLDVINLQEQLDQKLQQRQARETGICPIREELYSQCFGIYLIYI